MKRRRPIAMLSDGAFAVWMYYNTATCVLQEGDFAAAARGPAALHPRRGGFDIRPQKAPAIADLHVKIETSPHGGVRAHLAVGNGDMRRMGGIALQRVGVGEGRVQHQVGVG